MFAKINNARQAHIVREVIPQGMEQPKKCPHRAFFSDFWLFCNMCNYSPPCFHIVLHAK